MIKPFTQRELEVIRLIADGHVDSEIGLRLGISKSTAKYHAKHVLVKLDAFNRAHAVATAFRKGILT